MNVSFKIWKAAEFAWSGLSSCCDQCHCHWWTFMYIHAVKMQLNVNSHTRRQSKELRHVKWWVFISSPVWGESGHSSMCYAYPAISWAKQRNYLLHCLTANCKGISIFQQKVNHFDHRGHIMLNDLWFPNITPISLSKFLAPTIINKKASPKIHQCIKE